MVGGELQVTGTNVKGENEHDSRGVSTRGARDPDLPLVLAVVDGGGAAKNELLLRYHTRIYAWARRYVGTGRAPDARARERAEDLARDLLVDALEHLVGDQFRVLRRFLEKPLDERASFATYIGVVMNHLFHDSHRRRSGSRRKPPKAVRQIGPEAARLFEELYVKGVPERQAREMAPYLGIRALEEELDRLVERVHETVQDGKSYRYMMYLALRRTPVRLDPAREHAGGFLGRGRRRGAEYEAWCREWHDRWGRLVGVLNEAFATLAPFQQRVLELHYRHAAARKQIAMTLGVDENRVKYALEAGRKALRGRLRSSGYPTTQVRSLLSGAPTNR